MKGHVKAIGAAIGYTLVFHAGCWGKEPFLLGRDFISMLALMVLISLMLPLYFFVRNRLEKSWTLRGALLLSSTLLFCVTWAVADGMTGGSIFAFACLLECLHIGILLLDLLGEVLRLLARKMQDIPQPAWLIHAKVCLIDVNPNWKAFFAALLYLLFFYASPFIYEAFSESLDRFFAHNIFSDYSFSVYIGLMFWLYFSVRKRVERRWLFRGIVFLSRYCFIMLCLMFSQSEEIRNVSLSTYFIIAAFLLLDLCTELLQGGYRLFLYSKRRIQDRRA